MSKASDITPNHVAIIMDGNKRWAIKNNTSLFKGHKRGLEKVIEILEYCEKLDIKTLSLFAFSKENWKRSEQEIGDLMSLFKYFFKKEFGSIKQKGIKVIHSGLKDSFSRGIQEIIDDMVSQTKNNINGILNLALNYSGRQEIIFAANRILSKAKIDNNASNANSIESIDEDTFSKYLFHPELSYPELLIRTSGEKRISNFLLWQMAYTELYFTDVLWPDFSYRDFTKAIKDYQARERRFGGRIE